MSRRTLPLAVSLLAMAALVVWSYRSAALAARSGGDAPAYSDRRHDPYGTAALRTLLVERGVSVRTLERPTLDPDDRGVLIQVLHGPAGTGPRGYGRQHLGNRALADWVADGNTVMQFARTPTDLMGHLKVAPATRPVEADVRAVEEAEAQGVEPDLLPGKVSWAELVPPSPLAGRRLTLRAPMEFDPAANGRVVPLARLAGIGGKTGAVVAAQYPLGRGKVIFVGSATPVLNGSLAEGANLDFLLGTIGRGPVILDEWSHGIGHDATLVGFLHELGLAPVLLQAAIVAALYVWATSGVVAPAGEEVGRNRSSIEQVATLGFLYARSLGPEVTFDRVRAEVRRRLAEALRCRPDEIEAGAARLAPPLRDRVNTLLGRLTTVAPVHRVRCTGCGYELTGNRSGRCPECGKPILGDARRRIGEAALPPAAAAGRDPLAANPRRPRADGVLAETLTESYNLAQEIQRERRPTVPR